MFLFMTTSEKSPSAGLAVQGLDGAPGAVNGRRRRRPVALAAHLMIVAIRNAGVGRPEQAVGTGQPAQDPARPRRRRDIDQIVTLIHIHVALEVSLTLTEVVGDDKVVGVAAERDAV